MQDSQPGQVIPPQAAAPLPPDQPPVPPAGAPEPERPAEEPQPAPTPAPSPEPQTSPATAEPAAGWQFTREADAGAAPGQPDLPENVTWTASEFIAHEKSAGWYVLLALAGLVAATLIYLLTKDEISTGIVLFAALAFGIFAHRKPNTQQYSLNHQGLTIGQKTYGFQDFKTFSIAEEGAIASIVLMPLKRFMPPLTVYMAPDIEAQVVNYLSAYLPIQEHKADAIDGLLRRIRF